MPPTECIRWRVGAIDIIRVPDPEFELVLPQDAAAAALLRANTWLAPDFVDGDLSLRVGSSAIVLCTPSATIVVDPFLAFDDPARLAPRLAALRRAGIDPAAVDIVLNSHIDGVGANVRADGTAAFPSARYLLPSAELDDAIAGAHGDAGGALAALHKVGVLEPVLGGETVVPGVRLEATPGHSAGHVAVWVESGGTEAVITGHLFLHPAQIANPEVMNGDADPDRLLRTRRALLGRCVHDDVTLIGPLFAAPGGGKVRQDGVSWRLVHA